MSRAFTRLSLLASLLCLGAVLLAIVVHDLAGASGDAADEYRRQASTVGAVVAVAPHPELVRRIVARTPAGSAGALAVHLPGGQVIGTSRASPHEVQAVVATRRGTESRGDSIELLPVALDGNGTAVIELDLPDTVFSEGFGQRFALVTVAGLGGTALAVAAIHLRSRQLVRTVRHLADTAASLGKGPYSVTVSPTMPTELARLNRALAGVAQRWTRLRTDERKLMADLSHRLRTPLTALSLDAEAVGDGPVGARIRRSIDALEAAIDEVISGSDREPRKVRESSCDLGTVVADRMTFWAALAEAQGRHQRVDTARCPTPVKLTRDAVESMLDTLLVNVFRHTPPGSDFAVVVVKHANWITLVVDDAGTGIGDPEAALRRGASGSGSTGLGLDIARKSVESCGGTIHIEQSSLGGARVRLRLPEAGSAPADRPPRAWRLWRRGPQP
ncbi:HAMP domain-containing sensor histidine kinase [Saccharomonospora sp. NPDC046836]|uniref:sensor histidine kinase n=1 Tax=Saccharomonospora sp. NPDC046836 TaxID=3156921 RepID=UPI0033DFF5A4